MQPTKPFVQLIVDQQPTYFKCALLVDGKGVILNDNLLYIRKIIRNVLKLRNNVFSTPHTILMSMHRLRINAESTPRRTASPRKNLNHRESRSGEKIIPFTEMLFNEL